MPIDGRCGDLPPANARVCDTVGCAISSHVAPSARDHDAYAVWRRRWAGEHEGPLARGQEADRMLARAQAWAARHPR